MGVVNVTPDSFSDGGKFLAPDQAVAHALQLVQEGADLLDLGGESTRPGAAPVSEAEELRRVVPVITSLVGKVAVPLSIDTRKPAVAEAALRAGASVVNDIAANRDDDDDAMWRVVARHGAGYIAMHMQGAPETMQRAPHYTEVVAEVEEFFRDRLARLARAGVTFEQVALDVGIGFGKTVEHNLRLLGAMRRFARLGCPLVLGVSRKSFLAKLAGDESADRLPGSLACAVRAVADGVQILRVHDVAATRAAVRTAEAIAAQTGT
ncbi:MAG: dihydropteroate synthase [Verrucomicrobia bacterium]|nr:dihydropteroate synthase [Verrucomicrobiota bacterium]